MVTQLTYNVAYQIASDRLELEQFMREAKHNEWIQFIHAGFFYSFIGGQPVYHKVETACNCCRVVPERNYAGYGRLYLMLSSSRRIKPRVKIRDFVLFCHSCKEWRDSHQFQANVTKKIIQLKLF